MSEINWDDLEDVLGASISIATGVESPEDYTLWNAFNSMGMSLPFFIQSQTLAGAERVVGAYQDAIQHAFNGVCDGGGPDLSRVNFWVETYSPVLLAWSKNQRLVANAEFN